MSRERDLLLRCRGLFTWFAKTQFSVHPQAPIITEISSLLLQPEAKPVATVLGCDPYDERTDIRLTPDDWRRLNALPKGTLLYAKEPVTQQMPAKQRSDSEVRSLSAAESEPTQHAASLAAVARHKKDSPLGYAYFYENMDGTDTIRYDNGGREVNGSKSYRAEKIWLDSQLDKALLCALEAEKSQRDELRAEVERLRNACKEMNAALSRCAYLSGEPNEQECSWYDVEPYPPKAVEAVHKMRDELVKLRAQIVGMK